MIRMNLKKGWFYLMVTTTAVASGVACSTKEQFKVLSTSVAPSTKIDWLGNETALSPGGALEVGKPLPEAAVVSSAMKPEVLKADGRVKLISIVPSLDTEVCDRQTHLLNDSQTLHPSVERITISRDLPYAQRRFAEESKLFQLTYLSDYRGGEVGRKLGLEIERNGLLARAMIVVDGQGIVRYYQILPEIYALPDLERAFAEANRLAADSVR